MLNYYTIKNGKAAPFDCRKHSHSDDEKSVLVYADSPESAVDLAIKYGKGEIQPDYITCKWCNKSHLAVR